MREWPLSSVTRNMPLPSASCTSPSISIFSSATIASYTRHAARGPHVSSRSLLDVDRLRALLALALLVLDASVLLQRLEAVAGDVRVMYEKVLSPSVGRDEAIALRVVEPLHGSGCHRHTPPLTHDRTGKRGVCLRYSLWLPDESVPGLVERWAWGDGGRGRRRLDRRRGATAFVCRGT